MVDLAMNLHTIDPGRIPADQCHTGCDRGRTRINENEVVAWHTNGTRDRQATLGGNVFTPDSSHFKIALLAVTGDSKGAKLLAAFGVYALGFIMRPLGGGLLGVLADRHGRRAALSLSVQLMALGSLLLVVVPTYDRIGFAAPVIATIARLMQGLSTGGEFGAAITFLGETAPSNKRGLHGSFLFFGTGIGLMCASGIVWLLNEFLTYGQMIAYGWRVPFVIATLSGIYAWWLRRRVAETAIFEKARAEGKREMGSVRALFTTHRRSVFTLIGVSICDTFAFLSVRRLRAGLCDPARRCCTVHGLRGKFVFARDLHRGAPVLRHVF
ncbi:MFS transporter [Paraburkholderia sp. 40]|uniref:MFS transporter n=1 Tax=unclassified Paraburkholderia TaxID=2615204 RepID=UPI003D20D4B6